MLSNSGKLNSHSIPFFFVIYGMLFIVTTGFCSDSQNRFSTGTTIAAFAANIIMPGLGHAIIGNNQKANYYLFADMLLGSGALLSGLYSSRPVDESSKYFAYEHAYASLQIKDNSYWENIGYYTNINSYNREMERIYRSASHDFPDSTYYWSWDLSSSRLSYLDMRKQETDVRNNKRVVGNIMWGLIAGMVLDRIVSTIDLGLSIRTKAKMPVSMHVESSVWFDKQYIGLVANIHRL
jgi:hypothetical protein